MSKFIGAKNGKIQVISDIKFINEDLQILELPSALSEISEEQLLLEYEVKNNTISHKNDRQDINKLKVAFVINYRMACGISTYNEQLLNRLIPKLQDFKLFIEHNDHPTGKLNELEDITFDESKIEYCWKRGENLSELFAKIKAYNPDLIVIGHEFGLFPNARHWMSMMTQLSNYKILTTMHSIFPHHLDKTIIEASAKNIVVHSDGAKQALISKGNSSNIYVIPHGCYAISNQERLWNFYKSNATFMQIGFGYQYKSFEDCIEATALLKTKYPDVFFTALFSESPHSKLEHDNYYNRLIALINKLGVNDNVSIIRGFQEDKVINSFLRINKVAVFPYKLAAEHFVYGASGAARLAMSKGIPVISSSIPHFADIVSIKANNAQEISQQLDILFSDNRKIIEQVNKQNEFIKANDWEITATKYVEVLETL